MANKTSQKIKGVIFAARFFIILFVISAILLVVGLVVYANEVTDKFLPNSYFQGQDISFKQEKYLKELINKTVADNSSNKIKLTYQEKSWEISLSEIGWNFDKDKTQIEAFSYGHSADMKNNLWPLIRSLFVKREISPIIVFDEQAVEGWLAGIDNEIATPRQETNLKIKNGEAKVTDPVAGEVLDQMKVKVAIFDQINLKERSDIALELVKEEPIIAKQEAESLISKALDLTKNSVEILGPKNSVQLTSSNLASYIKLKKEVVKEKGFLSEKVSYGPAKVSFDDQKIRDFLEKNSSELNENPKDARFRIENGQIVIIEKSTDGKIYKADESVAKIIDDLEKGPVEKIEIPWMQQQASVQANTVEDIAKYGLKEMIGTATTDFKTSPPNRVHNIKTGTNALSGTVLKPGEEFSTIKHLGDIDGSTGYLQELVIKENSTVPEFGGGLCQVSTTLFRATMNAGLEIQERKNHSYRVSYYEPPVGMDATIYSPKPDFKFKNDTENYILIQGRVEGYKVTFDIYGTSDGRKVEVTTPVVYDITSPPEPIYVDDPSLEPGELKRIDRAHAGAKAYFYYRVTKNGKTNETKFNSSYVAWPEKYLRGPGEAPASQ